MNSILIRNGHLIDPANDIDAVLPLFIEDGVIRSVGDAPDKADLIVEAAGLTVTPGLVDMHVHLRDPGQEHKEDIGSGARAAAHGGVTSILAMPNTKPPIDCPDRVRYVENKAASVAPVHVYQVGAITAEMKGEALADLEGMAAAGAKAFSEDGRSVVNAELLRRAMVTAGRLGLPVLSHCEDLTLVNGGVMNADANAERLGLPGISNLSEDVIIARDLLIARDTGAHLHLCHCSTKGSVDLLRAAKRAGIPVSAETCPHYLILTSDDIPSDNADFKMNPPVRTKEDRDALRSAVAEGLIDVIVTDHAPHAPWEKNRGFRSSPFGIVGLETSAALIYTELVKTGIISLKDMILKMSTLPAQILGLPAGTLSVGAPADIAVFDLEEKYTIDPASFLSKSVNTPFAGREVYGRTKMTIAGGTIVYREGGSL